MTFSQILWRYFVMLDPKIIRINYRLSDDYIGSRHRFINQLSLSTVVIVLLTRRLPKGSPSRLAPRDVRDHEFSLV